MHNTQVVLMDWAGFPLYRERVCKGAVIKCGLGHILDLIKNHSSGLEFDLHLMINLDEADDPERRSFYQELKEKYRFISQITFRKNIGQDFGAFNDGYHYLQDQNFTGEVLFLNTTVNGPHHDGWLLKFSRMLNKYDDVGLCGISLHSHNTNEKIPSFAPHVGSYLFYTRMHILKNVFGTDIYSDQTTDKNKIISEGEIRLSREIMNKDYKICSVENEDYYYNVQTGGDFPEGDTNLERVF